MGSGSGARCSRYVSRLTLHALYDMSVYFYQRTFIRKYNEEGKVYCSYNKAKDIVGVRVANRFTRYSESAVKWTFKGLFFLFGEP